MYWVNFCQFSFHSCLYKYEIRRMYDIWERCCRSRGVGSTGAVIPHPASCTSLNSHCSPDLPQTLAVWCLLQTGIHILTLFIVTESTWFCSYPNWHVSFHGVSYSFQVNARIAPYLFPIHNHLPTLFSSLQLKQLHNYKINMSIFLITYTYKFFVVPFYCSQFLC